MKYVPSPQDISYKIHNNALSVYFNNIIDVCLLESDMCISSTKKKGIAGWNEHAEPGRNEASLGIDYGLTLEGPVKVTYLI